MTDQSTALPPPYRTPDTTPFVYFDVAATYGVLAGAIQIELAARSILPTPDGGTMSEFVGTAHLRCSPAAAQHLRQALDEALKMLAQPPQEMSAAGKLN